MKKILVAMLALVLSLAMFGCEQEQPEPKDPTVTSVEWEIAPAKTVYALNEALDLTGAKLKVTYSDHTTALKEVTPTMVTVPDMTTSGEKSVSVTYSEDDYSGEISYVVLLADRFVTTAEAFASIEKDETVYVTGSILSGKATEIAQDCALYSDGSVTADAALTVSDKKVRFHRFRFENIYDGPQGAPVFTLRGAAQLTLRDVTMENKSTDGSGALYGMIMVNDAAQGSKLSVIDSTLKDAHYSKKALGDTPALIGGGGTIELNFKNSALTAISSPEEDVNASWILFNGAFSGVIDGCTLSGAAVNSWNLKGLKMTGNTFEKTPETQLVIAGSFEVTGNKFVDPDEGVHKYIGVYGNQGSAVIRDNQFTLEYGTVRHRGVSFTSIGNSAADFDRAKLTVTGNEFLGTGDYAFSYNSAIFGGAFDFAGKNTLNGNRVADTAAKA